MILPTPCDLDLDKVTFNNHEIRNLLDPSIKGMVYLSKMSEKGLYFRFEATTNKLSIYYSSQPKTPGREYISLERFWKLRKLQEALKGKDIDTVLRQINQL